MAKIIFDRVGFCYPDVYTSVFENVSFSIDTDWKLGLIGRNGRGKTTLLKRRCLKNTSGWKALAWREKSGRRHPESA